MTVFNFLLAGPLMLTNVPLDVAEFLLKGVEDLGVAVVEKLAVLVLFLDGLGLEDFLAETGALCSHLKVGLRSTQGFKKFN